MIFDCVVRSAREHFRDLRPSISKAKVTFDDNSVFLRRPRLGLVDARIQMIVPTFAALLATSSSKMRRDGTPFLGSYGTQKGQR